MGRFDERNPPAYAGSNPHARIGRIFVVSRYLKAPRKLLLSQQTSDVQSDRH